MKITKYKSGACNLETGEISISFNGFSSVDEGLVLLYMGEYFTGSLRGKLAVEFLEKINEQEWVMSLCG